VKTSNMRRIILPFIVADMIPLGTGRMSGYFQKHPRFGAIAAEIA
jgi:hypothetical protein